MNEHILLVEDEDALSLMLSDRLQTEGYVVNRARDGNEGLKKATALPFDLIILDVMMPGRNGFDVCREIRNKGVITPVMILSARVQTAEKVVGLKLGADDYVTKPFEMLELVARVEALLRRAPNKPPPEEDVRQFGSVRVDLRGTQVWRGGKPVPLSAREFQLLRYFLENSGTTLSREQILREVWGHNGSPFTRTVDVHVGSLRQKLEDTPKRPAWIVTVQGFGYKFSP
jgi:two-component system alkaline phosphatase synthesis response regulator PhoP